MSRESSVFEDKLAALEDCAENGGEFYSTTVLVAQPMGAPEVKTVYVVAISEHQAAIALSRYSMPLTKWSKVTRDSEYIGALRDKVAELTAAKQPAEASDVTEGVQESA